MSYRLADGSMSPDYEIGDEFTYVCGHDIFIFIRDDGTLKPWFKTKSTGKYVAFHWRNLNPVKTTKHTDLIKSIRSTVQYLERTIQELES